MENLTVLLFESMLSKKKTPLHQKQEAADSGKITDKLLDHVQCV